MKNIFKSFLLVIPFLLTSCGIKAPNLNKDYFNVDGAKEVTDVKARLEKELEIANSKSINSIIQRNQATLKENGRIRYDRKYLTYIDTTKYYYEAEYYEDTYYDENDIANYKTVTYEEVFNNGTSYKYGYNLKVLDKNTHDFSKDALCGNGYFIDDTIGAEKLSDFTDTLSRSLINKAVGAIKKALGLVDFFSNQIKLYEKRNNLILTIDDSMMKKSYCINNGYLIAEDNGFKEDGIYVYEYNAKLPAKTKWLFTQDKYDENTILSIKSYRGW